MSLGFLKKPKMNSEWVWVLSYSTLPSTVSIIYITNFIKNDLI